MNPLILNYSQCIKQEAHWGYDKFHNICTGTWNTVSWGSMDWTTTIAGSLAFAALMLVPLVIVVGMIAAERAQAKMLEKFNF